MNVRILLAVVSAMLVLSGCTHIQQLGVQRQIGPLQRGDTHLIRTSPKATQVYALSLREVADTFAEQGSDGSSKHVFTLKDGSIVSIYHGPQPTVERMEGQRIPASFAGKPAVWIVEPRHTGNVAVTTVPDGNFSWRVSVIVRGKASPGELVAQVATMRPVSLAWPDPVIMPPTSHVDHMLLRGRAHCPPARGMSRGGHR